MIRVLLLEPDPWRHRGLAAVLQDSGTIEVSGETDYRRVLALATMSHSLTADVVGLAHRLVLEYGHSLIGLLRESFEPCSILVHGEVDNSEVAAQMLSAGARGYFVLSHPPGLYPQAVSMLGSGKIWGPREAIALMAARAFAEIRESDDERVSADDRQILALLNEGLSNKEIGQRLGLAEATIKARFNRLYRRFGVATRLQLLTLAIRDGILRPSGPRKHH